MAGVEKKWRAKSDEGRKEFYWMIFPPLPLKLLAGYLSYL
jgi:hypothetical protein